jgi:hypothetical protein
MEQKQTHTRAQTSVENSREQSRVTGCEIKAPKQRTVHRV